MDDLHGEDEEGKQILKGNYMIQVLEEISESFTGIDGGINGCVRDAIKHFEEPQDTSIKSRLGILNLDAPLEDVIRVPETLNVTESVKSEFRCTEMCQYAVLQVFISEEFSCLCKLIVEKFPGMKASSIFDFAKIHSRILNGEYEASPITFSVDMQEVWRKLTEVGTQLIARAKTMSKMSSTATEEFSQSANTFEGGGFTLIYLKWILQFLSYAPDQPQRQVAMLVNFLTLVHVDAQSREHDKVAETTAVQCLFEVDKFIEVIITSFSSPSVKQENGKWDSLRALLGFVVLEMTVHVTKCYNVERARPHVLQLAAYLPACGFTYVGLVSGHDVETLSEHLNKERTSYFSSLLYVELGASLSVIWGHAFKDICQAAVQDFTTTLNAIQNTRPLRWQTYSILEQILTCDSPGRSDLHDFAVNFVLAVCSDPVRDLHDDVPPEAVRELLCVLQTVQRFEMSCTHSELKKKAFRVFQLIVQDIPKTTYDKMQPEISDALLSCF